MYNWKQKWLAPALALAVAVPAAAYANTPETAAPVDKTSQAAAVVMHKHPGHHKHRHWHLFMGPHREMYFTLLAEKYTPEDLDEWKAALDERERLLKELKEQREANKDNPERKQRIEQMKQQRQELKAKLEKGEITREQFEAQLREWHQQWKEKAGAKGDEQQSKRKELIEKHRQLHEEFTKAVESQDANAIKAVLPKILAEVKLVNEHLAKKLQITDAGSSASSVQ